MLRSFGTVIDENSQHRTSLNPFLQTQPKKFKRARSPIIYDESSETNLKNPSSQTELLIETLRLEKEDSKRFSKSLVAELVRRKKQRAFFPITSSSENNENAKRSNAESESALKIALSLDFVEIEQKRVQRDRAAVDDVIARLDAHLARLARVEAERSGTEEITPQDSAAMSPTPPKAKENTLAGACAVARCGGRIHPTLDEVFALLEKCERIAERDIGVDRDDRSRISWCAYDLSTLASSPSGAFLESLESVYSLCVDWSRDPSFRKSVVRAFAELKRSKTLAAQHLANELGDFHRGASPSPFYGILERSLSSVVRSKSHRLFRRLNGRLAPPMNPSGGPFSELATSTTHVYVSNALQIVADDERSLSGIQRRVRELFPSSIAKRSSIVPSLLQRRKRDGHASEAEVLEAYAAACSTRNAISFLLASVKELPRSDSVKSEWRSLMRDLRASEMAGCESTKRFLRFLGESQSSSEIDDVVRSLRSDEVEIELQVTFLAGQYKRGLSGKRRTSERTRSKSLRTKTSLSVVWFPRVEPKE